MESVWLFKLGLRFFMKSNFQILNNQIYPDTFLKLSIYFLSKGCSYRELLRNVYRLPNFCAQQCVDEGVGLCTRHNLHCTYRMKNGKQHTAYTIDDSSRNLLTYFDLIMTFSWRRNVVAFLLILKSSNDFKKYFTAIFYS